MCFDTIQAKNWWRSFCIFSLEKKKKKRVAIEGELIFFNQKM